ncbi:MAG: hypothetical protein L6R38_000242 [Xanthoria sp. 2 TBL-2021]|nr:MAG: hypothetical protein L6R38_000242 [Xanthoria sp. 2 TBL-2021]
MANIALPNQVYSGQSQYNGPRSYGQPGHTAYNTFNPQPLSHQPPPHQQQQQMSQQTNPYAIQQPQQSGNMGPPSKPVDKDRPTDMNELSDVLMGSGVDLKEEEAALLSKHNQDGSFLTNGAHSFDSYGSGTTVNPAHSSYNTYSQNAPGGRDTFYGAGSFNQPAVSYQSVKDRAEAERKARARKRAEMAQYHLNEPFLMGLRVSNLMRQKANKAHLQVRMEGLYHPQGQQEGQQLYVCGPDKHDRLVTLKGEDLLNHDAPMVDLISLLSLAAEERLRTVIEDAAALAKERRSNSHGIVPPQFLDIAAVNGLAAETANGLPTPGNSAVSPKANPLKRSYSDVNRPLTPISNGTPPPKLSLQPFNPVTAALRKTYLADRKAEEERLAKRARRAKAENPDDPASASGSVGGSGAATPGSIAPDIPIDIKKLPTKKELKRQAESRVSDAAQARATNQSLGMALGGAKKSWMTGGTAAVHTNPMLPKVNTNTAGTAGSSQQSRAVNGLGPGGGLPRMRQFDLKEDGPKGVGIQLRDLLFVMEKERKEKRALARAYLKLNDES